ncbi:MAG: hypothetical protein AB7U46_00520 [Paenirhodobacter sp.]|uniref:hypothetical protein n=1 Tax=Paenirhodobacter sp. TaxID=1965326 RepID=UPI003D0E8FEA
MKPDLLLLGDSHTIALEEGARSLGLDAAALRYGGNVWHEGKFGWNDNGFFPKGSNLGRRVLGQMQERLGVKNVFSVGAPVLTTVGFHLGRLTRPFNWFDHAVMGPGDPAPTSGLLASDALAEAYVAHFRGAHIRVLKRLSREAKLIVVPPPAISEEPNFRQLRAIVIRLMQRAGLEVFDAAEALHGAGPVPAHLIEADGQHMTAEYGAMVIERLRDEKRI